MKVLEEGRLNWAHVCISTCGWCGSKLKFYLRKGDKRVTFWAQDEDYIKYICPVCNERNSNVEGRSGRAIDISREYRKLTIREYEEEVKPLVNEDVTLSDEDKAWLEDNAYCYD